MTLSDGQLQKICEEYVSDPLLNLITQQICELEIKRVPKNMKPEFAAEMYAIGGIPEDEVNERVKKLQQQYDRSVEIKFGDLFANGIIM